MNLKLEKIQKIQTEYEFNSVVESIVIIKILIMIKWIEKLEKLEKIQIEINSIQLSGKFQLESTVFI